MLPLLILAAMGSLTWSLRTRRVAWHCLGERPITLGVALQTVAIFMLVPPLTGPLNHAFHALTGQWNLQALIAHIACIASDAAIVYHLAWRAQHEDDLQRGFKTHVELPATLAVAFMFALWLSGDGSRKPGIAFYLIPPDLTMRLYWLVLIGMLGWLMVYALKWMFVLRQDPRSRRTVTIYIYAGVSGLTALALRAIVVIATPLNNAALGAAATVFGCMAIVGFASGAAISWTRKQSWFYPKPVELPQAPIRYCPRTDVAPF